jgi:galactokinase/mevalonate kinase-like predicted kinase
VKTVEEKILEQVKRLADAMVGIDKSLSQMNETLGRAWRQHNETQEEIANAIANQGSR